MTYAHIGLVGRLCTNEVSLDYICNSSKTFNRGTFMPQSIYGLPPQKFY